MPLDNQTKIQPIYLSLYMSIDLYLSILVMMSFSVDETLLPM